MPDSPRPGAAVRQRVRDLDEFLGLALLRYHRPQWLGSDPLALAHEWTAPDDREIVALLSALVAYGQVAQAVVAVRRVVDHLDGRPAEAIRASDYTDLCNRLRGWRHRVTGHEPMALLLWLARRAWQTKWSDAPACWREGGDAATRLEEWRRRILLPTDDSPHLRKVASTRAFRHLLPDPARGSACKRLLLFLRWMVRPPDGIDLGLWNTTHQTETARSPRPLQLGITWVPADLLMPVDTHVLRIAVNLGLIPAQSRPTLSTARRLTAVFREIAPEDPVRFDFALCRLGILQACPTRARLSACQECDLQPRCQRHRRMALWRDGLPQEKPAGR